MTRFTRETEGNVVVGEFVTQVQGRTFLLTGPSPGGIGAETVRSLAKGSPSMIILIGRSMEKAQSTMEAIRTANPVIKVKFFEVDLAALKSVRHAARSIMEDPEIPRIDVVINNAGLMACPFTLTEDGLELQLAANHLGHFVLTNTIMPKILAAGPGSRLVLVSSSGHRYTGVRFHDPNFTEEGSYAEFASYGQAKSAVILYAVALNKRLAARGIRAYALHPGSISTGLQSHAKALGPRMLEVLEDASQKVFGLSLAETRAKDNRRSLQQGCATTLRAALDPDLVNEEGVYLEDVNLTTDPLKIREWAANPILAEQSWKMSEDLVGEKFDF